MACVLMFPATRAFSQVVYHEHDTVEDIRIEFRWQRDRIFASDPQAVLNLQLTNLGDDYREVTFVAAFYRDDQIIFESEETTICLAPGQSKRGLRAGLRFMAEGITMEMIGQDWFSWDIPFLDADSVPDCD